MPRKSRKTFISYVPAGSVSASQINKENFKKEDEDNGNTLKIRCRLVEDLLLPYLVRQELGEYLKWVSEKDYIFAIARAHGSKADWNIQYAGAAVAWSKMKNLWNDEDPRGFVIAKHRLDCALNKHRNIQQVAKPKNATHYKLIMKPAWHKLIENLKKNYKEKKGVKTETDCEDHWENIRGRCVQCKNQNNHSSGSQAEGCKDHYITPQLHIMESFLQSCKSKGNVVNETPPNRGDTEHIRDEEKDIKSEKVEQHSQEVDSEFEIFETYRTPPLSPLLEPKSMIQLPKPHADDGYRKRKKSTSVADVNEQALKYFKKKQTNLLQASFTSHSKQSDPDLAFLQSLLPDMKCMDKSKKRKFKMGILKLADQLLDPVIADY